MHPKETDAPGTRLLDLAPWNELCVKNVAQRGSEIRPFEIRKHSKSGLIEGRISNGPYVVGFQTVPTIWKPGKWRIQSRPFYIKINNGGGAFIYWVLN